MMDLNKKKLVSDQYWVVPDLQVELKPRWCKQQSVSTSTEH